MDRPRPLFSVTPRMVCTYCGVLKLSQEILHMWPRDSEEVSQPGSIVSIKVVRNLFEEVGKGDGHDQPCARDIANRRAPHQGLQKARNARGAGFSSSSSSLTLLRTTKWLCNRPFVLLSWATQLPPTPWTSSVSESDPATLDLISNRTLAPPIVDYVCPFR